jgi:hypothetical protein
MRSTASAPVLAEFGDGPDRYIDTRSLRSHSDMGLPGPVHVGYKTGPTGYGRYRYLVDHGVRCSVRPPSTLQPPHGDG